MTKFAPAGRSDPETIKKDYDTFYNGTILKKILSAIPNIVLVLNQERQAVFCNKSLLDLLGLDDSQAVIGLRPGEIFNCVNASISEGGCGTTEFCRACGAVKAILETQNSGIPSRYECRMMVYQDDGYSALNLEIFTDEIELENVKYTTFHITNISNQKKGETLERLLFHDTLSVAGSMISYLDLISSSDDKNQIEDYIRALQNSSLRLVDEIKTKQELIFLESGKLSPRNSQLHSLIFLLEIVKKFMDNPLSGDKKISIDPNSASVGFESDKKLLEKAIQNLFVNAIENSTNGEEISIGCLHEYKKIKFWIKNKSVMPPEVGYQIFQKSFSTKGPGRGYGTYAAKLIIENVLNGSLSFLSNETDGTIFFIDIPEKI